MRTLWQSLYGVKEAGGYLGLLCAVRPAPGTVSYASPVVSTLSTRGEPGRPRPGLKRSAEGREAYFCAHLLTACRRTKDHAAPVLALWADADGSSPPSEVPEPTTVVESSPGRWHLFWRLSCPLPAREAEALNRRLSYALDADRPGWDLGQLLRPPGTRNLKYRPAPLVRLSELTDDRYHPRELELALPEVEAPEPTLRRGRSAGLRPTPDLSRLSGRTRALISRGNRDAGSPYPSRSEADFAVCLAMFAAGYSEADT